MVRLCPICKKPVPTEAEAASYRPFCSPRCKTVDLGGWLSGAYRIGRPIAEEDLDEGLPREGSDDGEQGLGKGKPS
jgi:endogenous inhibitor of DNA gyrase (YacG/DUF329 family)